MKNHIETMRRDFGYALNFLDTAQVRERAHTLRYFQGVEDPNALHFHPLNYCLGLALAIEAAGGRIFEHSKMLAWRRDGADKIVQTAHGSVRCQDLVFCAGGYGGPELQKLSRAYLPIATYVVLTEHLGASIKRHPRTPARRSPMTAAPRTTTGWSRATACCGADAFTTRNEQNEQALASDAQGTTWCRCIPQLAPVEDRAGLVRSDGLLHEQDAEPGICSNRASGPALHLAATA